MWLRFADLTVGLAVVALSAYGSCNGTDPVTVDPTPIPTPIPTPAPPLAAICGGPYQGEAGNAINFDGRSSTSPTGRIVTYEWDFGDGEKGTGATTSHTYKKQSRPPRTKDYEVSLKITDGAGQTATCKVNCTVTGLY